MRREVAKSEDLETASGATNSTIRTKTGEGRNRALPMTPECATEQTEHSWLGSLESEECTWTAWTAPTNATRSMQVSDRALTNAPLRVVCSSRLKKNILTVLLNYTSRPSRNPSLKAMPGGSLVRVRVPGGRNAEDDAHNYRDSGHRNDKDQSWNVVFDVVASSLEFPIQ